MECLRISAASTSSRITSIIPYSALKRRIVLYPVFDIRCVGMNGGGAKKFSRISKKCEKVFAVACSVWLAYCLCLLNCY